METTIGVLRGRRDRRVLMECIIFLLPEKRVQAITLERRRFAAVYILNHAKRIVELRIHDAISGNVILKWTDETARCQLLFSHSGSRILAADREIIVVGCRLCRVSDYRNSCSMF